MELRLKAARTTRDLDLALKHLPVASGGWDANVSTVLQVLREAGQMDLQDFFSFIFSETNLDLDAAPYGGARFPVDARLAGRTFSKFHVDVSSGDVLREPYESLSGRDWLGFAGISQGCFATVASEEQFAEKLHAYTVPWTDRENTRVKDLVDLVLLIERTKLDVSRLQQAIRETFRRRKTHDIPRTLTLPLRAWSTAFVEMAKECGLEADRDRQFTVVAEFFKRLAT